MRSSTLVPIFSLIRRRAYYAEHIHVGGSFDMIKRFRVLLSVFLTCIVFLLKVRTHNQYLTVAAMQTAARKLVARRS